MAGPRIGEFQGRVIEIDLETGQILWGYAAVHNISDYLQSDGEDASPAYALFSVNSAYYAGRPAFLKAPAVTLGRSLRTSVADLSPD